MTRNELKKEKTEPAEEELAIVETVVSPSIPAVEIEMLVEPEVGEEGVAVVKLITSAIVEIEDINAVEAVASVVEQEELTINEPMGKPPALEFEASPTAEGPIVLEHPLRRKAKPNTLKPKPNTLKPGRLPNQYRWSRTLSSCTRIRGSRLLSASWVLIVDGPSSLLESPLISVRR